jgi:hypothetical protein
MRPLNVASIAAVGSALLLIAGCAASAGRTAATSARQCFNAGTVTGFVDANENSVVVTTGPRDYYRLDTFAPCHDLDFRERIALKATSGSPWICSDMDAELIVPTAIGPRTCMLRNMHKLTEAEVRALKAPKGR